MKPIRELPAGVTFRPLPALPRYVVSACGQIFSRDARGSGWQAVGGSGSRRVVILTTPSGRVASTVAMLVAETWVGARPVGAFVKFRDGDRSNVAASNLFWGSTPHLQGKQTCSSSV